MKALRLFSFIFGGVGLVFVVVAVFTLLHTRTFLRTADTAVSSQ